jgi:FKBP-type peptidyl-prolyl cis-trans isomerase 2
LPELLKAIFEDIRERPMRTIENGDYVRLACIGQLEKKAHLGKTKKRVFEFQVGRRQVLEGLEKAVLGMAVGEKKSFVVLPEEGYGNRQPDLFQKVHATQFPEDVGLEVGKFFQIKYQDGCVEKVQISAIEDNVVTLDANHPLAGETLRFEVEVIDIS